MPEPVSPPPSAAPENTRTASVHSKITETVTGSPAGAFPVGPAFGPPAVEGEVGTLGPYRIVKELGKGGMGAVYLATDTRLKRKIALKVMLPEFAANAAAKERFLREAQAAAQITHDNVVTVYEADERDGTPYIAMQFLNGLPLDQFIKQKPRLTVTQILRITREAALGLSAAHKIGLVHRDIKPANLWLEAPGGRVKVLDFGLARPVHTEHELTQTGAVVGTPAYMSPEQARGVKVDHRTDLFSLGAVMYRLCTGELPFQGPTTMSVLMALGTEEPTGVRERNPEIPESVAALVHQLLAKKPEDRPQTADEVVKRIRAVAEELAATTQGSSPSMSLPQVVPVPVAPQPVKSAFADLGITEAEPASSEVEEAPEPARKKSGKGVWIGAGFAALLALAATVVIIIKNKDGTETKIEVPDGATVVVKVKDEKTVAQVKPGGKQTATDASPDRKAAEYVLSIGGTVSVNGGKSDIKAAGDLPRGQFALNSLDLNGKPVSDAGLMNLRSLVGLTHLGLDNTPVSDAGLAHLRNLKALTYLSLHHTKVSDAGLEHIRGLKGLTGLSLGGTKVSNAGLEYIKEFKGLTWLGLGNTQVLDAGLAQIKELKSLETLYLSETQVSDAGLAQLKEIKSLAHLNVKQTKVTAKGLAEFHAAVPGCKIEHDGGVIEPKVSDDRKAAEWVLSIGGLVQVSGKTGYIKAAVDLPKERFTLTWVSLDETKVSDAGLAHLKELKGLTHLYLKDTLVTDAGLTHLNELKSLRALSLRGTKVTDAGLWHLREFKGLEALSLNGTAVTDAGLAHLKELHSLRELTLNSTAVTDAGLAHLNELKELTLFSASSTKVTDAGLAHLKDFKELMHLNLGSTQVTDVGLPQIKELKGLRVFYLDGTSVSDAGLAHLKDCKNLTYLNLGSMGVTDAGLAHLKDCKNLAELDLRRTKVTAKGVDEFHAAVPGCKIEHDGGVIEPKK